MAEKYFPETKFDIQAWHSNITGSAKNKDYDEVIALFKIYQSVFHDFPAAIVARITHEKSVPEAYELLLIIAEAAVEKNCYQGEFEVLYAFWDAYAAGYRMSQLIRAIELRCRALILKYEKNGKNFAMTFLEGLEEDFEKNGLPQLTSEATAGGYMSTLYDVWKKLGLKRPGALGEAKKIKKELQELTKRVGSLIKSLKRSGI